MDERHWNVSPEQPILWIELDEKLYSDDGFGDKVDELTGELEVLKTLPDAQQRPEIWNLILKDFENVKTTYLRLRLKPGQIPRLDPENAAAYDQDYAKARTIKFVVGPSRGLASGFASRVFDGKTITGCQITIAPRTLADPTFLKHVLTHEMFHCLGLNHQQDDSDSLMSYSNNGTKLSTEERMALTHLYPSDPAYASESPTLGLACTPKQ